MDIDIDAGVRRALAEVREGALSVELTLHFCGGLVTKDAVAYPGAEDEAAGFQRERVGDLDLYWRQRLVVEGSTASRVSTEIVPRHLRVRTKDGMLSAQASYE
ncbi:MAG: hypothetical protein MUP97_09055 [Acidimicrobiia bacterium]|jgi:hypothetical protein|nr:hypothetical protein [Acidimicrobiia bacterium]